MIEFISVVENPSLIEDFEGGQSVQITWNIVDEQNDICQKKTTEIAESIANLKKFFPPLIRNRNKIKIKEVIK